MSIFLKFPRKSLFIVFLLFISLPADAATCVGIDTLPGSKERFERGKCFELQKDAVVKENFLIGGNFIIKSGVKLRVESGRKITVKRGGNLNVRGELVIAEKGKLLLELMSSSSVQGSLLIRNDASVEMQKSATLKSLGRFTMYPHATLSLNDNSKLSVSGNATFDNALMIMKGGAFENVGTVKFTSGTRVMGSKNAVISNRGRLIFNKGSAVELSGSSQLSNRRNIELLGKFHTNDTSSFVNYGFFELASGGEYEMQGGSSLLNQHVMEIKGIFSMSSHTLFENRNGFKIYETGLFELKGASRCVNRGSIYNAGGMSNTDEAVFDNKKSYFDVRDEKSLPQTSGTYHQTGGI